MTAPWHHSKHPLSCLNSFEMLSMQLCDVTMDWWCCHWYQTIMWQTAWIFYTRSKKTWIFYTRSRWWENMDISTKKLDLLTRTSEWVILLWRSCELFLHRDIITRTKEWLITVWRSCELFLHRDISLPKTMNMISTDDHHELVLVFMLYYYWMDVDFKGLCV